MSDERKPTWWFIADMLPKTQLNEAEFCRRYRISKGTWKHWKYDETRWDDPPSKLMRALSDALGVSLGRIYDFWDQGKPKLLLTTRDLNYELLRYEELTARRRSDPQLTTAVEKAIKGRGLYCQGKLREATEEYRIAIVEARKVGEELLVLYFMVHLLNLYEMTGKFQFAQSLYDDILKTSEGLVKEAKRFDDQQRIRVIRRLQVMAELRWLWTDGWARGVTPDTLVQALLLEEKLEKYNARQNIPYLHELLARTHLALGSHREAVREIKLAEQMVFALKDPSNVRYELFLDAGAPLPEGQPNYLWQNDQIRAAKFDILVAVGNAEEALEPYKEILVHSEPEAHLSIHHFWDVKFQQVLRRQGSVPKDLDMKQRYSPAEYDRRLHLSGDHRIRASNLVVQGQYYLSQGNYEQALFVLKEAKRDAWDFQARDVYIEANLGIVELALQTKNHPLAQDALALIQDTLHRYDNPFLKKKFEKAEEVVFQMFT